MGDSASVTGPKVFITYRREETSPHAGRLYDAMVARFGANNVFMDVDMAVGVDFVERITEAVAACQVLIVVMGPRWATVEDEKGRPRIADTEDFVRLEVETALRRPDVTPIPVLVSGAKMPSREDLPTEVRAITRRNALELSDQRWRSDIGRLMSRLDELLGESAPAASQASTGHGAASRDLASAPVRTSGETAPPADSTAPPVAPVAPKPAGPLARGGRRIWWVLIGALAIAAIAAVIVVAIGGGGGSDQTEEQVASVVDTWASTTDPGECRNLATDRLLQQGPVSCSAPALQPPVGPDSVDVTNVQVSGDTATADALFTGGLFDGQTLALSLVKESDQWKVDQLDDLADFDLQRFADAFAAIAPKLGPSNRLPVDQAKCVGNKLANQSPAVVAGKVLSAEFESYIEGLLAGCP